MGRLAETLVQALLPARCLLCRESLPLSSPGGVCKRCWALPSFSGPLCPRCGEPADLAPCLECTRTPPPWERLVAALPYQDTTRELILAFKHGQDTLAAPLARTLHAALQAAAPVDGFCITYVPITPFRLLARGYNQAALLAHQLARVVGWPCRSLLVRTGGGSQRGLGRASRKTQVSGAFRAKGTAPPRVLLVDDVVTTGATAVACTRALRRAGAREVWVACVARAQKRG